MTAPGAELEEAGPHRELVGDHMEVSVAQARPGDASGRVLERLAAERPRSVELVCVTDELGRFLGAVPLASVLAHGRPTPLEELMRRDFPRVSPGDDQEAAASLALHHQVDALPVVGRGGRLLGVMPSQALLQVLRREHIEDLHRLAGIRRESSRARHAVEDPPLRRAGHRLPWLLVGLAGSAGTTAAMAGFETTLRDRLSVAFFVPAIVYLADAVGTQTETIAVRGLSLTRRGIGPLLARELATGMAIGAVLGLCAYLPVRLAFGDARLAAAVSASVFAAGSIAAAAGLLLPWLLSSLRVDPAYGSGPVATVIQDVLSILVYFAVVRAFGI